MLAGAGAGDERGSDAVGCDGFGVVAGSGCGLTGGCCSGAGGEPGCSGGSTTGRMTLRMTDESVAKFRSFDDGGGDGGDAGLMRNGPGDRLFHRWC